MFMSACHEGMETGLYGAARSAAEHLQSEWHFSIITPKKMQLKQKKELRAHRPVWKMWVNPSTVQPTWLYVTFSE